MSEFRCPRCGERFTCGCNSCRESTNGRKRWPWTSGDTEACGHCGLQASADQWFEEEFWQLSQRDNGVFKHPRATLDGYQVRPHKWKQP